MVYIPVIKKLLHSLVNILELPCAPQLFRNRISVWMVFAVQLLFCRFYFIRRSAWFQAYLQIEFVIVRMRAHEVRILMLVSPSLAVTGTSLSMLI